MVSIDGLHKPRAIWAMIRVERCALVRSYALQCQRGLVLSGSVCYKGAKSDNSYSDEYRCDQTEGRFS
jgi:hypothetical protein